MLFHLPRNNWKFSKGQQYSTENDRDDLLRNFEKICTLNDRNYLLLANRCRSNPEGLKFNLHVTISQMIDGVAMETPIIIDPGTNNGGSGSTGGGAGGQESSAIQAPCVLTLSAPALFCFHDSFASL